MRIVMMDVKNDNTWLNPTIEDTLTAAAGIVIEIDRARKGYNNPLGHNLAIRVLESPRLPTGVFCRKTLGIVNAIYGGLKQRDFKGRIVKNSMTSYVHRPEFMGVFL